MRLRAPPPQRRTGPGDVVQARLVPVLAVAAVAIAGAAVLAADDGRTPPDVRRVQAVVVGPEGRSPPAVRGTDARGSVPPARPRLRVEALLDAHRRVAVLQVRAAQPSIGLRLEVFRRRGHGWERLGAAMPRADGALRVAAGLPRGRYVWALTRAGTVVATDALASPCPLARPAHRAPAWRCRPDAR